MEKEKNIPEIKEEFENYTKGEKLGEGSFGKAYLVKRKSDSLNCVMKQIRLRKLSVTMNEVLQEALLLQKLQHQNIVRFIEVYQTKEGKLCIIMEYADGK